MKQLTPEQKDRAVELLRKLVDPEVPEVWDLIADAQILLGMVPPEPVMKPSRRGRRARRNGKPVY